MSRPHERDGHAWLPVRVQRTFTSSGHVPTRLTVFCHDRSASIPLEDCMSCERCTSATLGDSGRTSHVRCRSNAAASAERALEALPWSKVPVGAVMTPCALCVRQDVSLEEVAELLLGEHIHGVPVVDGEGKPIGVVTQTDLLEVVSRAARVELDGAGPTLITRGGMSYDLDGGFHVEALRERTVGDVMTPHAFQLPEDAPVTQAAALMAFEGVHRIPVVAADGKVVGIISTLDLARLMAGHGIHHTREE